ncbi:hypothetical protein [Sporisorium scitamineum]|uniref:Uncharacterized protein n=1 Tax=Sporisorium scitamineum TaxID=49012 RepID=A0A0F7S9T9_9BASI|nr:hypothetical protein [Sporisorium scitamineum]
MSADPKKAGGRGEWTCLQTESRRMSLTTETPTPGFVERVGFSAGSKA